MTPERCGSLGSGDKVEFLTFKLGPATKTLSINFTGRVRLRVDVKGKDTVELTPDNAGIVPFVQGEVYLIEVTPLNGGGSDIPWRVTIVEN